MFLARRVIRSLGVVQGRPRAGRKLHCTALIRSREDDTNSFYDKYKDKLQKVIGKEPLIKPSKPPSPVTVEQAPYSYTSSPRLDSVMKVELIMDKNPEEISRIWEEYHKTKDCVGCVMSADQYVQMYTKATHCPLFVYPLPRGDGLEMTLAQFSGHKCYFTSLINYQMHAENAPVSLTLTHYTDLQESKGLVLMLGEIDTTSLTVLEAQYLANQVQLYYASSDVDRYNLVREFNHNPENFDYQVLVEQLSNATL